MKYQAILWDLDGTLVDSVEDIASGVNHARKTLGHPPFPIDAVRGFVGDGVNKLIERSFPQEQAAQALALFKEYYGSHLIVKTQAYPGLEDVLNEFHAAGIAQGVVTNKPTEWAVDIIEGLDLADLFDVILGGDHPAGRKPSPDPLKVALTAMGFPEFKNALMVGDGINDVKSAQALGIPVCGVTFGIGSSDELIALKPNFLAHSPADIQTLVLGL